MATGNNFYQGETITVGFAAYEDNADVPVNITGYDITAILYNASRGRILTMSTNEGGYLIVNRVGTSELTVTVPAAFTSKIYPGLLKIEVKLTERETGKVAIAMTDVIYLMGCKIGGINL